MRCRVSAGFHLRARRTVPGLQSHTKVKKAANSEGFPSPHDIMITITSCMFPEFIMRAKKKKARPMCTYARNWGLQWSESVWIRSRRCWHKSEMGIDSFLKDRPTSIAAS